MEPYENIRWYDKMLYALAHSIPRPSFAESAFAGRALMAATALALVSEVAVVFVFITELYFAIDVSTLFLWVLAILVLVGVTRITMSTNGLYQMEVPYRRRQRWAHWSWSAVAFTFLGMPIILVLWSYLE